MSFLKVSATFILALVIMSVSCSKGGNGSDSFPPSNLTLNATVNPDNSGNVSFVSTATNAVSYTFDFGNGASQISTSGTLTYKYSASGTYTVTVVAKSSSGLTVSKYLAITVTVNLSLVWSDEFNTTGQPDASKWGYDLGTGSGGWGNNELQYYTDRPDNVTVSGGTLKITAKREAFSGSAFTSARLLTKGKFSFKYGRIEVSAKLPSGGGTWPAIWMLGDNISSVNWPACGEIDVMEHVGNQLNKIYATLHYPGHSGAGGVGGTTMISGATTSFHKYTAEWNSSNIKFYVDDALFYTFANNNTMPFNQNFFLLLNCAMGGNFGGTVDPAFTSSVMEVDYVRIYQ